LDVNKLLFLASPSHKSRRIKEVKTMDDALEVMRGKAREKERKKHKVQIDSKDIMC